MTGSERGSDVGAWVVRAAEAPTRPGPRSGGAASAADLPTKLLHAPEPFARAMSTARSLLAVVAEVRGLQLSVQTYEARAIVRRCDARAGRATALATVAALAGVDDDVRRELRATLPADEAPHFEVAAELARAERRVAPEAFLEASAAVREAQRGFADGAFAALDGAPCFASGAFMRGHVGASRWLGSAPRAERETVVRDARADRDAGYWSRLRGERVDVSRFDVSAAYRAGVVFAEHVLATRGLR